MILTGSNLASSYVTATLPMPFFVGLSESDGVPSILCLWVANVRQILSCEINDSRVAGSQGHCAALELREAKPLAASQNLEPEILLHLVSFDRKADSPNYRKHREARVGNGARPPYVLDFFE